MTHASLPVLPAGGLVALSLQNTGSARLDGGVVTMGQVFRQGDLPVGASLVAIIEGRSNPLQLDVKSTWPDGSVRMANVSFERPFIAGRSEVDVVLARGAAPGAGPVVDLAEAMRGHSLTVDYHPEGGPASRIDVGAALREAIADGDASFWQQGAFATEARVEIPLGGSMRLLADVTAWKDGEVSADVTFANDLAMGSTGGRVTYRATIQLDGETVESGRISQGQYQKWTSELSSGDGNGGQGLSGAGSAYLNIVRDMSYVEKSGAIAAFDFTIPISEAKLAGWDRATQAAGWDAPLAFNAVAPYMPMTGGRDDIGIVTAGNAAWLISQDARAADYAMGQAKAANSIPMHLWDFKNDTWLNTDNYPRLWTDGRYGPSKPTDSNPTALRQLIPGDTGWAFDAPHQPELSFVPFILTGERWIYDNVMSQASLSIMVEWPVPRMNGEGLVVNGGQVRGSAWSLRQIQNAAFVAADGTQEQDYFRKVEATNWNFLVSKIPQWMEMQGETHGYLPGSYGAKGNLAPWQQEYFASTVISAASRGNEEALRFLEWQKNFLIGRFEQGDNGFFVRDGAAYNIAIGDTKTGKPYTTWAEVGAETVKRNLSNGADSWKNSDGGYVRQAMATLAGIYELTGDERAKGMYEHLISLNPPHASAATHGNGPGFAVTIPGLYAGGPVTSPPKPAPAPTPPPPPPPEPSEPGTGTVAPPGKEITLTAPSKTLDFKGADDIGTLRLANGDNAGTVSDVKRLLGNAGKDDITLGKHAAGMVVDLGRGDDRLTLAAGGSKVTVHSVETVIGRGGADEVTFGSAAVNAVVDLGGGRDTLQLGNFSNTVRVANVETIRGGTGADDVVITARTDNTVIDLAGGNDRLTLGNSGPNQVWVANVETIIGGLGADNVTLLTAVNGAVVDLGGGTDRLILSSAGANRLTVSNVETIIGGTQADHVTLATATTNTLVDLGPGEDTLVLANGNNVVMVLGVETVVGGNGHDHLLLGAATPGIRVSGIERITGSSGNDVVTLSQATSGLVVDLGRGNDQLILAAGTNTVQVAGTELVRGNSGADNIRVTDSTNTRIEGGAGNDFITGGRGDDVIVGGLGMDAMIGGAGKDRFVFTNVADSTLSAPDRILDFTTGQDKLQFEGLGKKGFFWKGTAEFANVGVAQARFVDASSTLFIDVDGNGTADMAIVLFGVKASQISHSDFIWT